MIIEDIIERDISPEASPKQMERDDSFKPTVIINEMKDLFNKRFSMMDFEPEEILETIPVAEFKKAITVEEFPKTRRASVRIMYLAKYLEDRLMNKKDEAKDDKPPEDNVLQILMEKPSIKIGKKVSRGSIKLSF